MNIAFENVQSKWSTKLKWFIGISLLFHLLFFYFYGIATDFEWVKISAEPENQEKQIVFELDQPKPKEVIETPDVPQEEAPQNANLLSDRNMQAKNPEIQKDIGDNPFNSGDISIAEIPKEQSQKQETTEEKTDERESEAEKKEETVEELSYISRPNKSFSRDVLLGKKSNSQQTQQQPKYDNRKFSVDDMGGFAFNTYNWNFAPYLIYLKKRIQRHIFPPPAFTKMGIIEGRSVVRFMISRDGKLLDLKVLNYEGHSSLMETSVNAVNGSSPFRSLPRDFPEEALEVTGTFVYHLYR